MRTTLLPPFFLVFTVLVTSPATEPESSSTLASGSPSRSRVEALHIAVAAMVSTKAIRMAISLRLLHGPTPLHLAESSISWRAAGPSIAMNSVGNRKQASGNNNFTAAFCAAARRAGGAWCAVNPRNARMALAIEVPNLSV